MYHSMASDSPSFPIAQPYIGLVENTIHALRLVQAAQQGLIPRVMRRLNDSERREMITSGAVFIFGVKESGIKRWTDSMVWSPSRIVNNFLVYKQMCESSGGRAARKKTYPYEEHSAQFTQWDSHQQSAVECEGLSGAIPTNGMLKVNGLIKKTITVTIDGSDLHLISYYTEEDFHSRRLSGMSSRPDIANLVLQPHLFRLSSFRHPPKVTMSKDGITNIVCEPDEPEPLEGFVARSPYPTNYSPDWPDVIVEDVYWQGLAAFSLAEPIVRDRATPAWSVPIPQPYDPRSQGQYDDLSMIAQGNIGAPYEGRGEPHWQSAASPEMQRGHGQVVHRHTVTAYDSQPQQQQCRPPSSPSLNFMHYDDSTPPPSSSYHQRSHNAESEKDITSGGQPSMKIMATTYRDESTYGNNSRRILVQDRHAGYDQPTVLSTNQNAATQSSHPGTQNSCPLPSSSSNNAPFALLHGPGNTGDMWSSNHHNGESYEFRYPELEPSPGTTQTSAHYFYSS